ALVVLVACSMKTGNASRRAGNLDPLILRAHFIGTEQLFAAPDSRHLKELGVLKSAAALREQLAARFAILPSFWLGDILPQNAPAQTNLFRPLIEDLLARESYLDCTATPDLLLAVKLPDDRARLWQTNLWQALSNWKLGAPATASFGGYSGFEVKRTALPGVIRGVRAGEWFVLSAGSGKFARETEVLANIKSMGRPAKATGAWLDGDANLARFEGWLPALTNLQNLPIAHFSLSNRADFVRTYVTLDFAQPHGWKPEPWKIPTNLIHEPLISFVAMRGLAPIFESFASLRYLELKPTPNQIIGWGYGGVPFQFNYAVPFSGARDELKKMEPKLRELLLGRNHLGFSGPLRLTTNGQEIIWNAFPGPVPHFSPVKDAGQEFLVVNCFPPMGGTSAPPQLYQAFVGRSDMAVFDFELTSMRVPHWRQFYQLAEIGSSRPLSGTNTPFQGWIIEASPKLGEAVTELRVNSPAQMTSVRKSTIGLTAIELVTLGRWLDSTNFPAFGVFPPAPKRAAVPQRK
ncbi:MAG TPA: hypothetical protein VK846_19515, partial [Candidatus Limnocylindria bacterium]|nr:hypothetical protein [Candidatus Limnocylindria bacterium]